MSIKRKIVSCIIIIAGIVLFIVGLAKKIPSDKLTTYSFYEGRSHIEEYVGGDAYNYIIGASLVGGQISGACAAKAIYIVFGMAFVFAGIVLFPENENKN